MSSLCIQIQNQLPTWLKICQQSNQCSQIPILLLPFPHTFRLHTRDTQKRTRVGLLQALHVRPVQQESTPTRLGASSAVIARLANTRQLPRPMQRQHA